MIWATLGLVIFIFFILVREPRLVYWTMGLTPYVIWGYVRMIVRGFFIMLFYERTITFDWDTFWLRYMYGTIKECWGRPVKGGPGLEVNIVERNYYYSDNKQQMKKTGRIVSRTNFGSYNYSGIGGSCISEKVYANESLPTLRPLRSASSASKEALEALEAEEAGGRSEARGGNLRWKYHHAIEEKMMDMFGKESCIVVSTGYATNSCLIPCMVDQCIGEVLIISDSLNHTSLVRGIKSCEKGKYSLRVFKHNDINDLIKCYEEAGGEEKVAVLVVVEGLYSMEGEYPPLREIVKWKETKGNVFLYLDEAHSILALGKNGMGICERLRVHPDNVDFLMGTFTKSFASIGGYITFNDKELGDAVRDLYYKRFCETQSPLHLPCSKQILGVLDWIKTKPGIASLESLRNNSVYLRKKLLDIGCEVLGEYDSPVVPVMIRDINHVGEINRYMFDEGFAVVSVGYPATPLMEGGRLRMCVAASEKIRGKLDEVVDTLDSVMEKLAMIRIPQKITIEDEETSNTMTFIHPIGSKRKWPLIKLTKEEEKDNIKEKEEPLVNLSNECQKILRDYGCGSCGPRSFYGTNVLHQDLENCLMKFYHRDEAILYADPKCVASSVIPMLVKQMGGPQKCCIRTIPDGWKPREDVVLGIRLSKAKVNPTKARKGISIITITGGPNETLNNLFSLNPERDPLKQKHLWLVDEFSTNNFGSTRNNCKYADIIIGNLQVPPLNGMGGFCVGSKNIVAPQRLYGKSYVFSASPPPWTCQTAIEQINELK